MELSKEKKMIIELLKKSLSVISILIFFSCTVSAPIIRESNWDITVVQDLEKDTVYEVLSIFLNCYDEDGENDIETVYFIDDESELYWELDSNNWDVKIIDETKWIGSASIMMPDRSAIPRSPLRIHVRDLSGETVEDKIYISKRKLELDNLKFPQLINEDDMFSLKEYKIGQIFIYSGSNILLQGEITDIPKSFEDIFGRSKNEFDNNIVFYISVYDVDLTLKSGPWY